jgi:PPM family protein phosphatase
MRSIFADAQLSNRGGRANNEDSTLSSSDSNTFCWVLADGLGGHGGGEEASRIACAAVVKSFQSNPALSPEAVHGHILYADEALRIEQRANPALARMRSTIVVLVANSNSAVWGHVGDSRLYHFRANRIVNQTKDHSVPQSLVDAGEIRPSDIRHHDDRSRLLRALGEEQPARPTVLPGPLSIGRGDAFLLCTDGFWENVYEVEMELDLAKSRIPFDWLSHMENRLQERVDGSHDNYTAVAILGDSLPAVPSPSLARNQAGKELLPANHKLQSLLKLTVFLIVPVLLLILAAFLLPAGWRHLLFRVHGSK